MTNRIKTLAMAGLSALALAGCGKSEKAVVTGKFFGPNAPILNCIGEVERKAIYNISLKTLDGRSINVHYFGDEAIKARENDLYAIGDTVDVKQGDLGRDSCDNPGRSYRIVGGSK